MSYDKEYEKPEVMHDLTAEGIVKLLRACFSIVGKNYDITDPNITQALCESLWKYYGGLWTQTFQESFQEAANGLLGEDIQRMAPHISVRYISIIIRKYWEKRGRGKEKSNQKTEPQPIIYTDSEAWNLFFKHIHFYGIIPANPNWIKLYNHCLAEGFLIGEKVGLFTHKESVSCENNVKDYIYCNYSELLHDNNKYQGNGRNSKPLRGIGQRAKEFLGV